MPIVRPPVTDNSAQDMFNRSVANAIAELSSSVGSAPNSGELTVNVPSIANGASYTSTAISVANSSLGDFVTASAGINLAGLQIGAYVESSGIVKFTLVNNTGGAVDLAAATYYVKVTKR